jgi:TonB family protein
MTLEIFANAAVRMLLIGAAAWLALRLFRMRNPHSETLVWRMVMLASLALPWLLYWRVAPDFVTSLQLPVITAVGENAGVAVQGARSFEFPLTVLTTIYLAVALLLLARLAVGLAGMWRISRSARAVGTPDDVRASEAIRSPATFGSIILLPAHSSTWPAAKLDAVLLHERAHVRSRDGHWSWLARVHTALFWFSPLAWLLQRRLEALAETTSDDAVIAADHDPATYAAWLLEFARHPNSRSVVMSVAESNVSARIERLLAGTPPATALPRAVRWAAFASMIPAVMFAASTTRAAPPEPSTQPAPEVKAPSAVKLKAAADPDSFYPPLAKAEGATGRVVVQVTVDPLGQVVDAVVVESHPSDDRYGFGDAAIQVAQRSTFTNSSQQTASMKFMVKFSPPQAGAPAAVKMIGAADPDDFYPPAAKAERVTGSVVVQVTVNPAGEVVDAVAVESQPSDTRYGFADAAIQVAQRSRFKNTSQADASMKFKVKFALAE